MTSRLLMVMLRMLWPSIPLKMLVMMAPPGGSASDPRLIDDVREPQPDWWALDGWSSHPCFSTAKSHSPTAGS